MTTLRSTILPHLKLVSLLALIALFGARGAFAQSTSCCVLPDNGGGTVDMAPLCPNGYFGAMHITSGFFGSASIDISAALIVDSSSEGPGGTLGGTVSSFSGNLEMTMDGTGDLAGYHRFITLPVSGTMSMAPRTSGDAVQDFDTELNSLEGQLFGDPDFCVLHLTAGTDFGMPTPGHTTLTRLGSPGTDFQVDSFFDVEYQIQWTGCPGSILDGQGGTSGETQNLKTCESPVPAPNATWGAIKARYAH